MGLAVLICLSTLLSQVFSNDDCVSYGSVFKLQNVQEGARLHSHEVKYGSGSGQQSVTGVKTSDDINSHWQLHPALGKKAQRGECVKCGDEVRLSHLQSGCFLHSHHFQAPLTKDKQEVSCFGSEKESDTGDNWKLSCPDEEWQETDNVQLLHVDTKVFLAMTSQQFGRPIAGQREVAGVSGKVSGTSWRAAEGVFMKRAKE